MSFVQRLVPCLALTLLVVACGDRGDRVRPNLILISIDTLRADHVGASGPGGALTPAFDRLAVSGAVFEQAYSTAPWTLPAHASLLSGLYPVSHGVKGEEHGLPAETLLLSQLLERAGWQTAGIVNSIYLSERYGFDRGFGSYDVLREPGGARSSGVFELGARWLEKRTEGPFFLFLHDYQVHSDYAARPGLERACLEGRKSTSSGTTQELLEYRRGKRDYSAQERKDIVALYAAGVRQMDEELGRFLAKLDELGLGAETVVCITSDHGEEFFEHGGVLHGKTQYEEVLRVPLVLSGPGVPAARRVQVPVSLVDVVPTLCGLLGVAGVSALDGVDLVPLMAGETFDTDRFLFGEADHSNRKLDVTRSVRQGRFKLVTNRFTGETALFDLVSDPGETLDVTTAHSDVRARLEDALRRFDQTVPGGRELPSLSEEERQRLEALGY